MQGPHIENWYRDLVQSLGGDRALIESPEGGYSEDCLYLNIWTKDADPKASMPVMVWIHGGSNKGGWAYEPNYQGHQLARQNVVVVSVPYRLGVFGFFSHPDLVKEQSGKAGNYGLLDLIAALRWIQDNIREFGGDPANITIFGESAGATNINFLMASAVARPLFQKAIHQSAGYQHNLTGTLSALTTEGEKLANSMSASGIDSLRKTTGLALLVAIEKHMPDINFSSVIGGHGLEASPHEVFGEGNQAPVPLMIGTNANEWLMYIGDNDSFMGYLEEYEATSSAASIRNLLSHLDKSSMLDRIASAHQMLCPSMDMAKAVTASNQHAYVYHFTRVRQGPYWEKVGAYHGAEIPYIFNTHDAWLATNKVDHKLSGDMQRYWVNFARFGNPNGTGLPTWRKFKAEAPAVMYLDDVIEMKKAPDQKLCQLLGFKTKGPSRQEHRQ